MRKTFLCLLAYLTLILQQSSIVYAMDEEDQDHSAKNKSVTLLPDHPMMHNNSNELNNERRHFFEIQQREMEEELRWEKEEAYRRCFLQEPIRRIFIDIPQAIEMVPSKGKTVETNGLKIIIPKDAVSTTTPFSIKSAPLDIQLPEHITPITALYEIEPHNVRFHDFVNLTFTIPEDSKNTSGQISLFIQKEDSQDKQLKKWLVLEPKQIENNTATFEVRSFSFPFVGISFKKEIDLLSGNPSSFENHNIIRPGLNYRAQCENNSCMLNKDPSNKELMIINRDFGSFSVIDEILNEKIKCGKCSKPLEDYESVKQVILFQAEGEVKYLKDIKGIKSKVQKDPFTAIGDRLIIYGEVGNPTDYKSFILNVNKQPFNPTGSNMAGAGINFDVAGNPIGSVFDLGVDGAFKNVKLLIGKFYNGEGFTKDSFEKHVGNALNEKGFNWRCTEDEADFLKTLPECQVAWVIGAHPSWPCDPATGHLKMENANFSDEILAFHKLGKGIMLWEDNDPISGSHTTETLKKLFGMTVEGNDPGRKNMIAAADCSSNSTFYKSHPIATGINNLYEGITICRPTATPDPIKVLATSSANHPNIMYVDETKTSGRIIIDCGFTKLYKEFWDTAGTARYVKNATCWLAGLTCDTM